MNVTGRFGRRRMVNTAPLARHPRVPVRRPECASWTGYVAVERVVDIALGGRLRVQRRRHGMGAEREVEKSNRVEKHLVEMLCSCKGVQKVNVLLIHRDSAELLSQ